MPQNSTARVHDQLQSKAFIKVWNELPITRGLIFHPDNDATRFAGESKDSFIARLSKRKSLGVVKGVWDIYFTWRGQTHIVEFKVGPDSLSKEQLQIESQMKEHGAKSFVIHIKDDTEIEIGVAEFTSLIKSIIC